MIAVAPPPPKHGPNVAVDRFDFAERNLLVAVVQDARQMPHEQRTDFLKRGQALPAEGEEPVGKEAIGGGLVGVASELGELLLEQVRCGQAAVEREQTTEGFALLAVEVGPAAQRAP